MNAKMRERMNMIAYQQAKATLGGALVGGRKKGKAGDYRMMAAHPVHGYAAPMEHVGSFERRGHKVRPYMMPAHLVPTTHRSPVEEMVARLEGGAYVRKTTRATTDWQHFVRTHSPRVRAILATQGYSGANLTAKVMRALSDEYRAQKELAGAAELMGLGKPRRGYRR